MRSMHRSRYYVQCPLDDHIDQWPDERFWGLSCGLTEGSRQPRHRSLDRRHRAAADFVAEPMRFGRMFLAGDAAISCRRPAPRASTAASDVHYLSQSLRRYYDEILRRDRLLFARALARVWKAVRFLRWMTSMLHNFRIRRVRRADSAGGTGYLVGSKRRARRVGGLWGLPY